MRLKYEYDEPKKKQFLSFWQINNLKGYAKKANDFFTFFTFFTKLSLSNQKALLEILFYEKAQGNLQIKNGYLLKNNLKSDSKPMGMPVRNFSIPLKEICFLDDVHFISIIKNRSMLNESQDIAFLTEEVLKFFEQIFFLENQRDLSILDMKSLALSDLDETFSLIAGEFLSYRKFSDKQVKKMLNHAGVKLCMSPKHFISFYVNPKEEEGILSKEGMEMEVLQEKLAYLIHCVDVFLYDKRRKRKSAFQQIINEKHLSIDEGMIAEIVGKLSSLKAHRFFHRLSFWRKVNVLFRIMVPKLEVIEEFFFLEEDKIYHPIIFCRLINKHRLQNGKTPFSMDVFKNLIKQLDCLGLINGNEKGYTLQRRSLVKLWEVMPIKILDRFKSPANQIQESFEDKMFIDSDMQLTIYRQQSVPEIFYLILNIGQLSINEYVITASWDTNRSTFCESVGMGYERLARWFELSFPSVLNENTLDYLQGYFFSSKAVEEKMSPTLRTFSNNAQEKISNSLKEINVSFINLGKVHGKYTVLFEKKKDYLMAKKFLKSKKLVFF